MTKVADSNVSASRLLTVDYSVRPSLRKFDGTEPPEVIEHPERGDVAMIDFSKVSRIPHVGDGEDHRRIRENLKERARKAGEVLLDVRVMEELLKHFHLIPDEWKNGITYFWGTILRRGGCRYVSCLICDENGLSWGYEHFSDCLNSRAFAAVLCK